jgi:hypothetical protein
MEPGKDFRLFCYAVHLGSTENIKKRSSGAPSSYYFCQNETLYSERVNGLFSKIFCIFYRPLFFVFIVRQKVYPPCNSKTLYVMFTDSKESLEAKVRDRVSPYRLKKIFAYKRNKANLDPFHMCFTISL